MTNNDMPQDDGQFNGPDGRETSLPKVFEHDGMAKANSLDVAEYFGKNHQHVMRDIRELIEAAGEVCRSNFGPTCREVPMPKGGFRLEPAYEMTRDGFTLLAMGFTGKKALEFKLRYIEAFNRMEEVLNSGYVGMDAVPANMPKRRFEEWSAADQTAACRMLDKYEQLFPGKPGVLLWAARRIGFDMPPKDVVEKVSQGDLFGGEG